MLPAPNVLFPSDPQTEYTVVFCLQICLGDDPAELVNAGELFRHGNMASVKKTHPQEGCQVTRGFQHPCWRHIAPRYGHTRKKMPR